MRVDSTSTPAGTDHHARQRSLPLTVGRARRVMTELHRIERHLVTSQSASADGLSPWQPLADGPLRVPSEVAAHRVSGLAQVCVWTPVLNTLKTILQ